MKTALIPTDFNLDSTKVIDALLLKHANETFRVIFFHAFKLSDSISDLLLLSRRSREYEIVSDAFYARLNHYKDNCAPQLHSVGIEYFYGSTVATFKNFLEALSVDCIVHDAHGVCNPINKFSIDPKYLTDLVSCEKIHVDTAEISKSTTLKTQNQLLCY